MRPAIDFDSAFAESRGEVALHTAGGRQQIRACGESAKQNARTANDVYYPRTTAMRCEALGPGLVILLYPSLE